MPRPFFIFKFVSAIGLILSITCAHVTVLDQTPAFSFSVVDVGKGLSQIGVACGKAIVWDMGDVGSGDSWRRTFERLGSPEISAIVISHSHTDHMGGFSDLPLSASFSGRTITHPGEDTAAIRKSAGAWGPVLIFSLVGRGDTIAGLTGVRVQCLWPPRSINDSSLSIDTWKNRYSMCFLVSCNRTAALITSDIDSMAEQYLADMFGFELKSDIMVVPHHGSESSANEIFFGYVNPSQAIISCAISDGYGFPSERMKNLLYQMRIETRGTYEGGSVTFSSDGYYWE
jgi:competence protein ComEC